MSHCLNGIFNGFATGGVFEKSNANNAALGRDGAYLRIGETSVGQSAIVSNIRDYFSDPVYPAFMQYAG